MGVVLSAPQTGKATYIVRTGVFRRCGLVLVFSSTCTLSAPARLKTSS